VFAGTAVPVISNNYIHGGGPAAGVPNLSSAGLFFVGGLASGNSGWRVLNNIIDGGGGATRYGAYEEGPAADPGRFQNNNLVFMFPGGTAKSVLYRNCTPTTCDLEYTAISDVNTQLDSLTGPTGQTTFGQGGCINALGCLVNPAPRTGDVHQAAMSKCIDLGLERNKDCNICQTPWSDAFGTHRLSSGWSEQTCSQNGVTMSGDDLPDIGPAEQ
jgi:hypothetical protein